VKINDSKLERFFAEHEFTAPFLLCTSDCESLSVGDLFKMDESAGENFKNLWLGYTETLGDPRLREEISRLYTGAQPGDVMVCAGAEEGIFLFMNALLDPGDHLIVQFPAYQSLYEIANAIGCRVTRWHMDPGNGWNLDPGFLEDHITPQTRAIVINFPNNPTGAMISRQTQDEIITIARKHGTVIFSDEVYRYLEYDEKDRLPSMCDVYENGVSLGVMSKSFGLAGLRIGWLVTKHKPLFEQMAPLKDFTTICSSGPSEFLTTLALEHKDTLLERNRDIIKTNLKLLESFFTRFHDRFDWVKPTAGPLVFPKLNFTADAGAFCLDLLEKKGVLLAPSSMFNYDNRFVRIGFGRKNMPEALARLEEYLWINH
jgi:aspartate/methionine/tyrosine aminotransferase